MWWRLAIICSIAFGLFFALLPTERPLADCNFGDEGQAKKIVSQSFRYLGSGGQTDVFASEDGSFVLKLFKNHPRKWIPLPNYRNKKLKKLQRDIGGYILAATDLPEESGLIFCHLTKTFFGKTTIYDQKGKASIIDLGKVEFILQKRAIPFYQYFAEHPSKDTLVKMKNLLQQIAEKKLVDHDPRLHKNIGILGGKAVLIDPGKLVKTSDAKPKFTPKFHKWIKENYPEFEGDVD